jgi:uncharacterized membrane protein
MKNRRCIFFFLLVFLSIWSKNTFAQLAFRNNCNTQISLAIKYIPFPNSPYWVTSGWWNIQPGYTQTVLTGSLINRYFYFYAKSSDGFVWSGYTNTCINDNGFERREYNNQNACLMGDYSVPFQQIDVGSYTDYIFSIELSW